MWLFEKTQQIKHIPSLNDQSDSFFLTIGSLKDFSAQNGNTTSDFSRVVEINNQKKREPKSWKVLDSVIGQWSNAEAKQGKHFKSQTSEDNEGCVIV